MMNIKVTTFALALTALTTVSAQQPPAAPPKPTNGPKPPAGVTIPTGVATPADYVIGPDDVLAIVFWREKDMSSEVAVRPDGQITLPLINDVQASGLTPQQLREKLTIAAAKFLKEDPTVSVIVKAINSRKVTVVGMVGKQGPYPLTGPTTVMQMLAIAGGVHEFAKTDKIKILRTDGKGKTVALNFNYKKVMKGQDLHQNIELKPGDTIIVP